MAERGVHFSHTTILRWVIRYILDFEWRVEPLCTPLSVILAGLTRRTSVFGVKGITYIAQ